MERPVQAILTLLKNNSTYQKATDKELYELLAHTVNRTYHKHAVCNAPSPVGSRVAQTNHSSSPSVTNSAVQPKPQQTIDPVLVSQVTEQLIPYIARSKDAATPLLDVDWLYFIDSGGQPQFHQLLPAFMHHTNLNIFVLRLCDKLSDHPTVEYYDERGTCTSSTASLMTNKEILQCCAQATQTADQDGDSRLIIVGTHQDLQCDGETLKDKNEQLLELLTPSLKNHLMYCNRTNREVIFPMNTKKPDEADRKVIQNMCKSIQSMKKKMKPKDIPLRWLVFLQEIQSQSKNTKSELAT